MSLEHTVKESASPAFDDLPSGEPCLSLADIEVVDLGARGYLEHGRFFCGTGREDPDAPRLMTPTRPKTRGNGVFTR